MMSCIKHRRRIGNPKIVRIVPGGRDKAKLKLKECVLESCTYDGQREKERAEIVETETLSFAGVGMLTPPR